MVAKGPEEVAHTGGSERLTGCTGPSGTRRIHNSDVVVVAVSFPAFLTLASHLTFLGKARLHSTKPLRSSQRVVHSQASRQARGSAQSIHPSSVHHSLDTNEQTFCSSAPSLSPVPLAHPHSFISLSEWIRRLQGAFSRSHRPKATKAG